MAAIKLMMIMIIIHIIYFAHVVGVIIKPSQLLVPQILKFHFVSSIQSAFCSSVWGESSDEQNRGVEALWWSSVTSPDIYSNNPSIPPAEISKADEPWVHFWKHFRCQWVKPHFLKKKSIVLLYYYLYCFARRLFCQYDMIANYINIIDRIWVNHIFYFF